MSTTKCPYCDVSIPLNDYTYCRRYPSFMDDRDYLEPEKSALQIDFIRCPNCEETIIEAKGYGAETRGLVSHIKPISTAKCFPDYIPPQIKQDYEEACAIVNLSPKASATLSRRCLQGMIHDYWNIKGKNLNAEITSLQSRVQPAQWKAIDALRLLGNIGAHMEKDVNTIVDIEPNEANKLIKLIELLMSDWYIQRHEQELLYAEITNIGEDKEEQRKGN